MRFQPTYAVHTMPGLQRLAWREIAQTIEDARLLDMYTIADANGMVLFRSRCDPSALQKLRTIEDLFVVIARGEHLPWGKEGLQALSSLIAVQVQWHELLSIHRAFQHPVPPSRKKPSFRVIARLVGQHGFYRKQAQSQIERTIHTLYPHWEARETSNTLEIWVTVLETQAIITLRLSNYTLRHRPYKQVHLPASLRPSVAATMVLLSRPEASDVFLDPMCGAGTILLERAHWGRYQQLLGGDIRLQAIEATLANIGTKYQPIHIEQWDATHLIHLGDQSISKVVCNLPFGKQLGSRTENEQLYERFLHEMARLLPPGGCMVLLTGDPALLLAKLQKLQLFSRQETHAFLLLGTHACIFVLLRRG